MLSVLGSGQEEQKIWKILGNGITTSRCCLREETSLRLISPTSIEKNRNNRGLPSTYFTKRSNFDSAAPVVAVTDRAGRGRVAGKAAFASRRNAYPARAVPPSGTAAQLPL